MAIASTNTIATGGIGRRIETLLARFADYRKARAVYRQTYTELAALTDRDLNDLGIARVDIHRIARDAAGMEG